MSELSAWKHVFVDERSDVATQLVAIHRIQRDAVIQDEATGSQQPIDLAEINRQIPAAHVLEHTDAGDLVVRCVFRDIAIIAKLHIA